MTPYDIIWYSLALLVASIPTAVGMMFIGASAVYIKREWNKKVDEDIVVHVDVGNPPYWIAKGGGDNDIL